MKIEQGAVVVLTIPSGVEDPKNPMRGRATPMGVGGGVAMLAVAIGPRKRRNELGLLAA